MDRPHRKWQLSLRVVLLLVGVIAIGFAIWIPREKPPRWFTLDSLLERRYPDKPPVVVGNSISGEFQLIQSSVLISTKPEEKYLHPEVYTIFYKGKSYQPTNLKLEPDHRYSALLAVVRGEQSPQWIVIQID